MYAVLFCDIRGHVFCVDSLYGMHVLRNSKGTAIGLTDDIETLIGTELGWHALCEYKARVAATQEMN